MSSQIVTHPREQLRQLREKLAQAAQQIIDALDALDGDSDFELTGDENETSVATMDGRNHVIDFKGDTDDREVECDDEGHDSDTEPNGDELDYSQSEDDGPVWYDPLQADRQGSAGQPIAITYLDMDRDGNVSFVKDGQRWTGGRLNS